MDFARYPVKAWCCIICAFCIVGTTLPAVGRADRLEITGRVKIYGSAPHTYVGIESAEDGTVYSVYPPEKEEALRELQGRLIRFKVKILDKSQENQSFGLGSLMLSGPTVTPLSWKIVKR
ncbi:MAG: hypothetical protein LBU99_01480 [Spirochaetaceae bacterium]|jgi:hypothetical protein|nr:hypothetical protein [Spirochaetaceae bacterium]